MACSLANHIRALWCLGFKDLKDRYAGCIIWHHFFTGGHHNRSTTPSQLCYRSGCKQALNPWFPLSCEKCPLCLGAIWKFLLSGGFVCIHRRFHWRGVPWRAFLMSLQSCLLSLFAPDMDVAVPAKGKHLLSWKHSFTCATLKIWTL